MHHCISFECSTQAPVMIWCITVDSRKFFSQLILIPTFRVQPFLTIFTIIINFVQRRTLWKWVSYINLFKASLSLGWWVMPTVSQHRRLAATGGLFKSRASWATQWILGQPKTLSQKTKHNFFLFKNDNIPKARLYYYTYIVSIVFFLISILFYNVT